VKLAWSACTEACDNRLDYIVLFASRLSCKPHCSPGRKIAWGRNAALPDSLFAFSASPFEGVAERLNWLGAQCKADSYCNALVAAGVKEETIKAWSVDPQVKIAADGKKVSIFDALEDMDAKVCMDKLKALQALQ